MKRLRSDRRSLAGLFLLFVVLCDAGVSADRRVSEGVRMRFAVDASSAAQEGVEETLLPPSLAAAGDAASAGMGGVSKGLAAPFFASPDTRPLHRDVGVSHTLERIMAMLSGDLLVADKAGEGQELPEGLVSFDGSGALFDGDLFLSLYGDEPDAAVDHARLSAMARDAEQELSVAAPSSKDRHEVYDALSGENVEELLSFATEHKNAQAEETDQAEVESGVNSDIARARKAADEAKDKVLRDNKRLSAANKYYSIAAKYVDGEPLLPWVVRALVVGFLDGATFGLSTGVLDAVQHDTCAAHRDKVALAFSRVTRAVGTFFRGLFGPPESRGGRTRLQLVASVVAQLACFFKSLVSFVWRCRPLLVTLGMLVAVIGAALVINLALIATGYGLVVKIVEIVLTIYGLFSGLKKSVLGFARSLGRCTKGSCSQRDILTMVESLMETVGLLVGAVYLSGITRLLRVKHVREALAARNARLLGFKLDPELSLRVSQFATSIKNLRSTAAAAKTAARTRSAEPLRAAVKATKERQVPASEVYASARSLVDDAKEAVRVEQRRVEHYGKTFERLGKEATELKAAGDGAGFTRANNAYLDVGGKLSESTERAKAAEYALQSARRNLDEFVIGYGKAFPGRRPSVKLMDDAVARFRKVHAADMEIDAATVSAFITADGIQTMVKLHASGTNMNQYAARQVSAQMASQMGQVSTKLVSQADDYLVAVKTAFADADDLTAAIGRSIATAEAHARITVVQKVCATGAASTKSAQRLAGTWDSFARGMSASLGTKTVTPISASQSQITASLASSAEASRHAARTGRASAQALADAGRTMHETVRRYAEDATRAARGVGAAQQGGISGARAEDAARREDAAAARERAMKTSEDWIDKSGLKGQLEENLLSRYTVTVKVKAGRDLKAAGGEAGGFYVVLELVGGDGESPQRAVTPHVSGTSAVIDGAEHKFDAGSLSKRPLRLYVFRRGTDDGSTLNEDLIGVATVDNLDGITDRGRFVSFTDVPVWSLAEAQRHVTSVIEAATAAGNRAAAAVASDLHAIADRFGITEDGEATAPEKLIETALGSAAPALAGRLDVDIAVLLRAAPSSSQTFNVTMPGTPPSLASPAESLASDVAAALDGWGTDSDALSAAAASLRAGEASNVRAAFRARYHADLVEAVREDTRGDYRDALVRLFSRDRVSWRTSLAPRAERAAIEAHRAMDGFFTDEERLIAALTHGDATFNAKVADAYKRKFGTDIVDDIKSDTSGDFQTLMIRLVHPSYETKCADV